MVQLKNMGLLRAVKFNLELESELKTTPDMLGQTFLYSYFSVTWSQGWNKHLKVADVRAYSVSSVMSVGMLPVNYAHPKGLWVIML